METRESKERLSGKAWVPVVLAAGVLVGAMMTALPTPVRGPGPGRPAYFPVLENLEDVGLILSGVSLALLVALLFVYARTYADTRARFALGIVFVLGALLLEAILSSPLLFHVFGFPAGSLAPFLLLANGFKIAAFTIFLYLSLE